MRKSILFILVLFSLTLQQCREDQGRVDVNIVGLRNLGPEATFEGWLLTDTERISTGKFTVNDHGNLSQINFNLDQEILDAANAFVITIEPADDQDPESSGICLLAGDITGSSASLTVGHTLAIGDDFSESRGTFLLGSPTNGENTDETSGVWFVSNNLGEPEVGLELPELAPGWIYEGWVIIDDRLISTGTFSSPTGTDNSAMFSGNGDGLSFPGEDFLENAPEGFEFPLDLRGAKVSVSVEPINDNSHEPFAIQPLSGEVNVDESNIPVELNNDDLRLPFGTISFR